VAREVLELSEFDIELKHVPELRMEEQTRYQDAQITIKGTQDNENVTVLPDPLFIRTGHSLTYIPEDPPQQNEDILRPWVNAHNLKKVNGEWWKEKRKVITAKAEQKRNIIKAYHDLPAYGHPGISRTTNLVQRYYWWPQMAKDIYDYVKGCAECQRHKVNTQARKAPLYPITPIAEALPFQTIALDFIVKLPVSNGFDSILTITDHDCTKAALMVPCKETINAEEVAHLYLQQVFPRFGLPSKVISDRDPRFTSKFMRELCKMLGSPKTSQQPSTPNRRTVRKDQPVVRTIPALFRGPATRNWHHYLPTRRICP
jgi:hypothetical protein